jgi:hypothetical protein
MSKSMSRRHVRTLIGISGGFALLIGVLVSFVAVPAAQAKAPKITANGSIYCANSSGTMTFHPPLTPTGTAPERVTFVVTASDCTTSDNTNLPPGTITAHVKATSSGGQDSSPTLGLSSGLKGSVGYTLTGAKMVGTIWSSGVDVMPQSTGDLVALRVPHMTSESFAGVMVTSYADWETSNETSGEIKSLKIVSGPEWW